MARHMPRALRRLAREGWVAWLVAGLGCRTPPPTTVEGPTCRDVASQAHRVLEQAGSALPETERFYAEVVDLCQRPGLSASSRACLVTSTTVAAARSCPALPAAGTDADMRTDHVATIPGCDEVVRHAMRILAASPDAPRSDEERVEEAGLYASDCAESSPDGHRCAIAATTVAAIDDCLADHRRDEDAAHP